MDFTQLTEAEYQLMEKIQKYESLYFEDFTLQPDSILHDFLSYQIKDDSGNWIDTYDDLPSIELFFNNYCVKIESLEDCSGICDNEKRIITIDPESVNDQPLILHEMIHAYITILNEKYFLMTEPLLLKLFTELLPKVPDLNERIIRHSHNLNLDDFIGHGWHGILFFLKSLDLDLRLDLTLGTVCGYGRDKK